MKKTKILAVILSICLLLTSMPLSGFLSVFAQSPQPDKITICGSEDDKTTWIYQDVASGLYIREFEYDMDENANASVDIIQLTDLHVNKVNENDTSEALVYSKGYRENFYPEGSSIMAVQNAMDYAAQFDQTVITGDIIDYLSDGALDMTKEYIWDEDPTVMATPGNHEFVQVVGDKAEEVLTFEERKAMLQSGWIHDLDYYSKLVDDKVLCITMNNASIPEGTSYRYLEGQAEKLAADIALARENGYIILIFQHLAISTGNEASIETAPLAEGKLGDTADIKLKLNLYDNNARAIGGPSDTNEHTRAVYDLITKNADVIKGLFAGHVHNHYYSEVVATDNLGNPATIPQYILSGNFYSNSGNATKITINYHDDNLVEPDKAENVTLDETNLSLNVGDNYRLTATVAPATADDKVTWTSSDNSVATVNSNGRVVGVGAGSAKITATDANCKKEAECTVVVTNPEKPNILKVQGSNASHHIGKTFTGLAAGTYIYSVYSNNTSGGSSVPFVIEDPYSVSGSNQYPKTAALVAATAEIGTTSYTASSTHNVIEITFTVTEGKSYFCGVTGSSDTLPVYYTGFSLKKQGSDKNLFPSEFLGNGLTDFELYAGSEPYYYGCRPQGSKFALLYADGTGKFAYPEDYTTFDNFFGSENVRVATSFAGGDGTEANPYLISNAAELKYFANMVNNVESGAPTGTEARWVYAGVYFKLTDDIYLNNESEYSTWSKTSAPSSNAIIWEPIGYSSDTSRDFAGIFDGDGHTIYGLYCSTTHEMGTGLFGSVRNGVIKNLTVKNAYLTTTSKYVGGIVGIALANTETIIDNCGFSGDIVCSVSARAGGIAGRAYPHGNTLTISNCWTKGTLTATGTSAGLVGEVLGVKDKELVINNCYTAMDFDSTANSVAGLIGYVGNSNAFKVSISNCHVAGTSTTVYPLLGETLRTKSAPVTLDNVYYVTGSYTGEVKNVETKGKITATNVEEKTADEFANGTVTDLLNATIDPETAKFEWVQGDKYPEIKEIVVIPDGWDGSAAETFAGGDGTEGNPYLISNAAELKYFANMVNNVESGAPTGTEARWVYAGVYFKLTADIYLNNESEYSTWSKTSAPSSNAIIWEPIGYSSDTSRDFAGIFDGDGHTIYGLYCSTTHEMGTGLFGSARNGIIKNLTVKNAYLTTTSKYVGGIVGIALANTETIIDNCGFSGDIVCSVSARAGGIAGRGYAHGNTLIISNCWTEGTLTATGTSGGLIGELMGVKDKEFIIRNCYTAMDFDSTANSVAGLAGYVGNSNAFKVSISNCHVAGTSTTVYPLLGETLRTKSAPVTLDNVYYVTGSYTGEVKNVETKGKITATNVEEKTADEFANGTVTALLNGGVDKTTDTYEWTQGVNYPILQKIDEEDIPPVLPKSSLTDLAVSSGTLNFNGEIFIYNIGVENEVSSISVTPTQAAEGTVITVNGVEVASGTASASYDLEAEVPYEFIIVVTEPNSESATYYLTVTRSAPPAGYISFSDDFSSATGNTADPLGNGWLYGDVSAITIDKGNPILIGEVNREQATTRVVRPANEARKNQKMSVEFDAQYFNTYGVTATGGGNDRPRVLVRIQNENPEIGDAVAYYADIQWGDKISIGSLSGGNAIELFNSNGFEGYIPNKPTSGTYKLELLAEGTYPTKLTVNYYETTSGNDVLVKSYSVEDSTTVLQSPGSVGFHIAGTAKRAIAYTGFNYVGTDEGNTVPEAKSSYLTNLTISNGTLNFNSETYVYNVSVGDDVSSIQLTPSHDSADTVIKVNGATVTSGTATSFDLECGVEKSIIIEVTEKNATTAVYTVNVFRQNPPAGLVKFEDDFSSATGTANDPLGNGWLYGDLSAITVDNGKAVLIGELNRDQGTTRVVRPTDEARKNQKVSVDFNILYFDTYGVTPTGGGNDRPRVLARIQNTNPEQGNVIAYYADIQWGDRISIGRLDGGVATELLNSNTLEAYIPNKPSTGTYKLELLAEGTYPTKLTLNYYDTTSGNDVLVKSYTVEDSTAALQNAGSVGFHITGTAKRAIPYTGFSYTGTDEGNVVPEDKVSKLTNLTISAGELTFDSETYVYDVIVSNEVSSIKVTPSHSSADAVIMVDGKKVTSGKATSFDLELDVKKVIVISVTEKDAITTKYTVNILRKSPPAGFAGGSGTFNDPYLISTAAQLLYFAEQVNDPNSDAPIYEVSASTSLIYRNVYFRLTNDIVLNADHENYADWLTKAPQNEWTPIGMYNKRSFGGNFNGAGYTIYGLYCNTATINHNDGTGLFGRAFNATIEHVTVKNACIIGKQRVGGIAGSTVASSIATINNCGFVGVIKSTSQRVGGITGQAQSQNGTATVNVNNCWSKGVLMADSGAGLIGFAIGTDGTQLNVNNCYSAMYITANSARSGGLLGHIAASGEQGANYVMTVRRCHFAGYINKPNPICGDKDPTTPPPDPICEENVYYMEGSYEGEAVNTYGAIEKTAKEFADGTVTELFKNGAANPVTDMWEWTQGEEYPVHNVSNDPVNFLPTLDDSLFNDGDWAANLENRDGGNRVVIEIEDSDAFEDFYEDPDDFFDNEYNDSDDDEIIIEEDDSNDKKPNKKPVKSDKSQDEEGNNSLVIILSILGAVLAAGVVLLFIFIKKKKNKKS